MTPSLHAGKNKRVFDETLKSARLGVADAQYEVGLMFANGIGTAPDLAQALDWIRQAAKQGLASAQFLLATRYEAGVGVEQSASQALRWFSKAAEQGHMKAVFRLGKLLGRAHPQVALDCYRSAAQAGQPEGQYALARAYAEGVGLEADRSAAVHWYRLAAEQGLPSAQCELAHALAQGNGVAQDMEEALRWYRKAASNQHLAAQVALLRLEAAGVTPARGQGHAKRRANATERRSDAERWVRAAEAGNADARYHLGLMFEHGWELPANAEAAQRWYHHAASAGHAQAQLALSRLLERAGNPEAAVWYQMAAAQGDAAAQFAMGRMCCAGELLAQDFLQGLCWYVRAAEQGHTTALVTLGQLCNGGLQHIAAASFSRAAEAGSAQAQYLLGQQYAQGLGLEANLWEAFYWYVRAAEQGLAEAQAAVGVAYLHGLGVEKDTALAFDWLQQAAHQGNAQAQWNLGALYASGNAVVKKDLKQAFVWCQRAADQGFVAAQANLGVLHALLQRPQEAVAWWQKAAAQDDPEAIYNLALALLKGEDVPQDIAQGFGLLLRAAEWGLAPAQSRLGILYATGEGVAQDPIEAHKWFVLAAAQGDAAARTNKERSETLCDAAQLAEARRRAGRMAKKHESETDPPWATGPGQDRV